MGQWVNFAEVRARVSLEDVLLRYYEIENLKRDGRKLIGPCPVHGGDSPRAFHADLDKNVWHCFSRCQKGGNQLDLVAQKDCVSIRDAALRLQAFFLAGGAPPAAEPAPPPGRQPTPQRAAVREEDSPNAPLDLHLDLKGDHPHLVQDRALKVETIERFGLGYCSRGILRGTIAIPIHNDKGELVAYAGRRLKPSDIREMGKYRFPKGFKKEVVLYNFHRALPHERDAGLILVEGFFSVVKLHQAGFPNAVATMGCALSEAQADLLALSPSVSIVFDGNEAGWSGAEAAARLLASRTAVRLVRLPEGLEPEDVPVDSLRWLVGGAEAFSFSEVTFTAPSREAPAVAEPSEAPPAPASLSHVAHQN